jgi:hypothetical protein
MTLRLLPLFALACACASQKPVVGGPFPGDPENFTYDLEGTSVTLAKGTFEQRTGSGPDDLIATDLTGHRLDADLDGDESTDRAVVLTRDEGALKAHFLVVLRNPGGPVEATPALRLGVNVLVERVELDPKGGAFVVSFKGRDEGVAADTPPTVDMQKRFTVKDGKIVEAAAAKAPAAK